MVERTTDMELISMILNHPKVYDLITDDASVPPCVPNMNNLYLTNETRNGILTASHVNGITCEVHIAVLPELWGRATGFFKECIAWGFENTRYMKVIGFTPVYNRAAISLAKRCGFKEEGRLKDSFLKNWELHDQIVFGISIYGGV
jgi:RimJ/RimL family protein N-acetyltransferase